MEGLEQASQIFWANFKITARGMSRSYWAEDAEHLAEVSKVHEVAIDHDCTMSEHLSLLIEDVAHERQLTGCI